MATDFENFKEQVRAAADIVEVVSSYVTLKKRGNRYWGCCPFHGEKTPSFTVTPGRNMFFCFGCHEGGDVFKFVMKSENCSFSEAVKHLANRYGIPVPEKEKTPAELAREKKTAAMLATNELANRYFHACLTKTGYGKQALAYLAGRGITPEIIESFSLGYALNSFNGLLTSLGKRGYKAEQLLEAGLVKRNDRGYYDTFRHRVMIPIKNARGGIVGFGGRSLDNAVQAKYLNTGETAWFNKKYLLFGLDVALKNIRSSGQAIVVEGYMDAISLHAAGFGNVVASMGTAFTAEQARILKRIAKEVIFCYDSDAAGRNNSVRAVSVALQNGLENVRIAGVPEGKDPDEYVRQQGAEAFQKVLDTALNGIDFQIEWTISQNNVTNLAGKVETVSNILPFLLECNSEIEVAAYIRNLAERLTLGEQLILDEYRKLAKKGSRQARPVPAKQAALAVETNTPEQQAERMLLAVLIEKPGLLPVLQDEIEKVGYTLAQHQQIYAAIAENYAALDINRIYDALDETTTTILAGILANCVVEGDPQKIAEDSIRSMRLAALEKENLKHCQQAAAYMQASDPRYVEELRESQRIKHEIKELCGN